MGGGPVWEAAQSHSTYQGKISGNKITAGCDARWDLEDTPSKYCWATGAVTLQVQGKHRIRYHVDEIHHPSPGIDIFVGVASRTARVKEIEGYADHRVQAIYCPEGCYCWCSHKDGMGSYLQANRCHIGTSSQKSQKGSNIDVIIDQYASTVEFLLDGAHVTYQDGSPCKLTIKPQHKRDLTPVACVQYADSALTLVELETVVRSEAEQAADLTQKLANMAVWGSYHNLYTDPNQIEAGTITKGCGNDRWATGTDTLPVLGKYCIQYRVISIGRAEEDIYVGVASRVKRVDEVGWTPHPYGAYCWISYCRGDSGSRLYADEELVQRDIPQQSKEGSIIKVIVDQDNSTVEFRLDGAPVGNDATACKLTVKPEHKLYLTPAACVYHSKSSLTLVSVSAL